MNIHIALYDNIVNHIRVATLRGSPDPSALQSLQQALLGDHGAAAHIDEDLVYTCVYIYIYIYMCVICIYIYA